jgi:plasmid maintenance system antidote protein VapI
MTSYVFDIGERARRASRFITHVRAELQRAFVAEKSVRKITQQKVAELLGVNRSVVNRQLTGEENLTLRSVAELAWALGWQPVFELRKQEVKGNNIQNSPQTGTGEGPSAAGNQQSKTAGGLAMGKMDLEVAA